MLSNQASYRTTSNPCYILILNLQITQQQQTSNNVVVNSQPSAVSSTVHVSRNDQSSFIFGVVVSVLAIICLCWWSLVCTIPGTVVGHMVSYI